MRTLRALLCASALAGLFVLATAARAADEKGKDAKISKDNLPEKITSAIKGRFPGADVTNAEKETEDGKVVFDIELKHEGRKYEMDIQEDGTIMEIEKEVASKDVPTAVTKAVTAKYAGAKVKEVMEVNLVKGKQETPDHYEVSIDTGDGKEKEVIVALDGSSVKEEAAETKETAKDVKDKK